MRPDQRLRRLEAQMSKPEDTPRIDVSIYTNDELFRLREFCDLIAARRARGEQFRDGTDVEAYLTDAECDELARLTARG